MARASTFELTLAARAYAAGDTVSVMVKNVSGAPVMYVHSFCQRALERQHGPAWTVAIGPGTGCVLVAAYVGPGRSTPLLYRLPADLPPGVYRITIPDAESAATNTASAAQRVAATPPFTVGS